MNITDIEIIEEHAKVETKTDLVESKVQSVMSALETMEIDSPDAMEGAAEWLRKNKATQKFVKEFFEDDRKKTYDAYQAVTKEIKRFTDILTKAEKTVKRKMADYQLEQERIRREEEEKRRKEEEEKRKEAEEKGETPPPPAPVTMPEAPPEEEEKLDGVSFVEVWTYTIEDTSQIPREYMIPDEKKIRDVVKAMKGDTNIPGIKVYVDKQVRARA